MRVFTIQTACENDAKLVWKRIVNDEDNQMTEFAARYIKKNYNFKKL